MHEDRAILRQEIARVVRNKNAPNVMANSSFVALEGKIKRSQARLQQRLHGLPSVTFPEELPISEHQAKLSRLIKENPVVIVCGETGSGKSTQIPKICLSAGFGIQGMICQTQPRRIAARSVAERISGEIDSKLGEHVGYRIRFNEQISESNYVRVLTDGMLLAEFERDRFLSRYEVLIVDEAHERSLNIDFLLGLSKKILEKRSEFRLIITSATLDIEKYSKDFGNAPTMTVSGRTYPVECRYRPLERWDSREDTLPEAIGEAIQELHEGSLGDVLVFLPGEREIRETAAWLKKHVTSGLEILPLYARLTSAEQHRIFHPGRGTRIILATNVAETSITVPGIRYVIDSGLARISRYSPTRKLQRLPLEKISQASADQRAGRCGRTSNGICVRLYDEEDYLSRSRYTDPEIQRTSLTDVMLRMKSMGIGEVESFPFIDRPGRRHINDGIQQLIELGAFDHKRKITHVGRRIAGIPVDPRIGRMLLAAGMFDCLEEVVVIASALSLPDPRYSPAEKLQHARQKHRALSKETSDFLLLLDIWRQYRHIQKTISKRQSYRWCEENYLSVFRMREWGALQASLKRSLKQIGFRFNRSKADEDVIHRALLPGLLSNVAQLKLTKERKGPPQNNKKGRKRNSVVASYYGTFGKQVQIFPGSAMRDQSAKWIMSAELVDTGNVYARTVASIKSEWLETAAEHLLQYHYSDPYWNRRRERVTARKRATLYGLTIYSGRKCDYSKINPGESRAIFIRSALVDGGLESKMPFYIHNRDLVEEIESLEHRTRRRDILVDDDKIFQFYDDVLPNWVNSASDLRKWYRRLDDQEKAGLMIPRENLMLQDPNEALAYYPDTLRNNGISLDLDYLFDPSSERDGVSARIPISLLNKMNASELERIVPGLLSEKLVALVRSLPKHLRRQFVPIPDSISRIEKSVGEDKRPLLDSLAGQLSQLKGVEIKTEDFDMRVLPHYLTLGLELVDEDQKPVDFSRDLQQLQSRYGLKAHVSFLEQAAVTIERQGIKQWDFGDLPSSIGVRIGDYETNAYPALVDCLDSVAIQVFDTREEAEEAHLEGVRRLLWLGLPAQRKLIKKPLPAWQQISLMYAAIGDLSALQQSIFRKAQDRVYFLEKGPVRTRVDFEKLLYEAAPRLPEVLAEVAGVVRDALKEYRFIMQFIGEHESALSSHTLGDVRSQLEWLIYDGFVDDVPAQWLVHLPRFLKAISVRLEQARIDPETDRLKAQKVIPWWRRFLESDLEYSELLENWRWMIEEYRVSVFAQSLKTSIKISSRRLEKVCRELERHTPNPHRV